MKTQNRSIATLLIAAAVARDDARAALQARGVDAGDVDAAGGRAEALPIAVLAVVVRQDRQEAAWTAN
jgi:hypothetical protein